MNYKLFGVLLLLAVSVQAVELLPASYSCFHDSARNCTTRAVDYLSGSVANPTYLLTEYSGVPDVTTALILITPDGSTIVAVDDGTDGFVGVSKHYVDARITVDSTNYYVIVAYAFSGFASSYIDIYAVDKFTFGISILNTVTPGSLIKFNAFDTVYSVESNKLYILAAYPTTAISISAYYANGTIYFSNNNSNFWAGVNHAAITYIGSEILTAGGTTGSVYASRRSDSAPLGNTTNSPSLVYDPVNVIVATWLNSTHLVASTNSFGQYELIYFPATCATACTPTRLTETGSVNEAPFNSIVGGSTGQYAISAIDIGANPTVVYNVSGAIVGKYLCDNNELSDSCEGEASYGEEPDSAQVVIVDRARCASVGVECAAFAIIPEDWLAVQYAINDKIALPDFYGEYTAPSEAYIYANASCYYSTDNADWTLMNWGLNTSSNFYSTWDYTTPAFVSDDVSSLSGQNIYVKCNSSMYGDLDITERFILQNTYPLELDYYLSIGNENAYNFVITDGDANVRLAITRTGSVYSPNVLTSEWYLSGTAQWGGFYESGIIGNTLVYNSNQYLTPAMFDSFGYHTFVANSRSLVADTRFPSFKRIQPVLFQAQEEDLIDVDIGNAHLEHYFYGGAIEGLEFEEGQDAVIVYDFSAGVHEWKLMGSDTPFGLSRGGYREMGIIPPYYICYVDVYDATSLIEGGWDNNVDLADLPAGSYTGVINCQAHVDNTNYVLEGIGSDSSNYSFTVLASGGCAQTAHDCGLNGSCMDCGTVTLACESGEYIMQSECQYDQCDNITAVCPPASFIYDIDLINDHELSCIGSKETNLVQIGLTKYGAPVSWGLVSTPVCNLFYGFELDLETESMPFNAESGYFEVDLAGKAVICDKTYSLIGACSSVNFSSSKVSYGGFNILYADYCEFDDYVIPMGECVSDITGNSADKPLYCSAAKYIVNMSSYCGCPTGSTANTTTNGCDGKGAVDWLAPIFDFNPFSLGGVLFILIFGGMALIAWKVTKQDKEVHIVHARR